MTNELLSFILVVLSALPMGLAEGKIIGLEGHYTFSKVFPIVLIYLFGVALYFFGFMQIPHKIGFIIGIWEISAVTIALVAAISKQTVKWDWEYTLLFSVIIGATYILGLAADKIFSKAGL